MNIAWTFFKLTPPLFPEQLAKFL